MKKEKSILMIISRICGIIPLTVGWSIFLIWAVIFLAFDKSIHALQRAGFWWIVIGFFMACLGIVSLLAYCIVHRKKLNREPIKALGILLSNIPSVFVILYLHGIIIAPF